VPFVLRGVEGSEHSQGSTDVYRLVGEAYIKGIMKGEVLNILTKASWDDTAARVTEASVVII
jgi:hypothetical protein